MEWLGDLIEFFWRNFMIVGELKQQQQQQKHKLEWEDCACPTTRKLAWVQFIGWKEIIKHRTKLNN